MFGIYFCYFLLSLIIYGETEFILAINNFVEYKNFPSVQVTNDGGFIVTGYVRDFGAGGDDVLLSKFNYDGEIDWAVAFGESENENGFSVVQLTDDGFFVSGATESFGSGSYDVLLSKFNFDGTHNYTIVFGGSGDDQGYSVQETRDGGFIIAGFTDSFGCGSYDVLLSKFNFDGTHNWTIVLGGIGEDKGCSVQETRDGGYIFTGFTESFGSGSHSVLLSKFNFDGSHNWTIVFGESGSDKGYSVRETRDGGFIVVGYTNSFLGSKMFLSKFIYYENGANITNDWTIVFGGYGNNLKFSVEVTSDGGYIVIGPGSPGDKVLLSKFNSNGTHNWTIAFGEGDVGEYGESVAEVSDGLYVISGWTCNFRRRSIEEFPDYSVFLAELSLEAVPFCDLCEEVTPTIEYVDFQIEVISSSVSVMTWSSVIISSNITPVVENIPVDDIELEYFFFPCFGEIDPNISCSTHGDCVYKDTCQCFENYFGDNCEIILCNGIFSNETVCSGHGSCVYKDTCQCFENYFGDNCEVTYCEDGTHLSNQTDFIYCSGHGFCGFGGGCQFTK